MGQTPDLLVQIASRHAVHMEGVKTGYVRAFEAFLRAMEKDILSQLALIDEPDSFRGARLNKLMKAISKTLDGGFGNYETVWRNQLRELGTYEADFELRALQKVVKADFTLPSPSQLYTSAFSRPLSVNGIYGGSLLDAFFEGWTDNAKRRIEGAVRLGFAQGKTTAEIVRNIRGTRKNGFRDGIVQATRRDIDLMARTSLHHVANSARSSLWEANDDIVDEVEFLAVLDGRTSLLCRGLSGERFKVGEGPIPPLHIACRSTRVAVLKDGLDFLDGAGRQFARGENGVERVSPSMTYYEWLATQSAAFQDSVIGPSRGRLLRNGGLSSTRFSELQLDKTFSAMSLDDMRELEPLAFEQAGI